MKTLALLLLVGCMTESHHGDPKRPGILVSCRAQPTCTNQEVEYETCTAVSSTTSAAAETQTICEEQAECPCDVTCDVIDDVCLY